MLGTEDQRGCTALVFTPDEVRSMLDDCDLGQYSAAVEHRYDGYRCGEQAAARLCCPWSIAGFCAAAWGGGSGTPKNYREDSSSDDIINLLPDGLPEAGLQQLRTLLSGGSISIKLQEAPAYHELRGGGEDALFSMLYLTGCLTCNGCRSDGLEELIIPNEEVRECFRLKASRYLNCRNGLLPDMARYSCGRLVTALGQADAAAAGACLQELLAAYLPLTLIHGGSAQNIRSGSGSMRCSSAGCWHRRSGKTACLGHGARPGRRPG